MRRIGIALLAPIFAACARPAPPATVEPAPAATPAPAPVPRAPKRAPKTTVVRIAAVGDVLLHDGVQEGARDHENEINCGGFDHLYQQVSQYVADADLTFANLETPVTEKAPRGHGRWLFNSPVPAVKALKRAGVDVVSVANNHALDQGQKGLEETLTQLDALGLVQVGAGRSGDEVYTARILDVEGVKVAFLAWTQFVNEKGNDAGPGKARVGILDEKRAVKAVRAAAAKADAVVVSVHWGVEYKHQPRKQEVALAKKLVEAGATAVIGHHPHVLQPIEEVVTKSGKRAVIFYSLGNFISNQGARYEELDERDERVWGARRDGALVRFELVRTDYGGGLVKVELGTIDALPLWTENNHLEIAANGGPKSEVVEAKDAKRDIHVVSIDRALANVRREKAKIPQPVPDPYLGSLRLLERRESLYLRRRAKIAEILGENHLRDLAPEAVTASR